VQLTRAYNFFQGRYKLFMRVRNVCVCVCTHLRADEEERRTNSHTYTYTYTYTHTHTIKMLIKRIMMTVFLVKFRTKDT
jgi:hypothetical protein